VSETLPNPSLERTSTGFRPLSSIVGPRSHYRSKPNEMSLPLGVAYDSPASSHRRSVSSSQP
jgi:hypothetical protein